jgi:hypothetical protein
MDGERGEQAWRQDGPVLPIEFSRISGWTKKVQYLSLVIDDHDGTPTRVRHALSNRATLADTISDLMAREGTPRDKIGFVDLRAGAAHSRVPAVSETLKEWARTADLHAVVWTDLEPNFPKTLKRPFATSEALAFLESRQGESLALAREYVLKAPPEVDTPVRRLARESGWLAGILAGGQS